MKTTDSANTSNPTAVSSLSPDPAELRQLRTLAEKIATVAGHFLLAGLLHKRIEVDTKSTGTDMVTEMDRGAELRIVEAILDARPDDGLLGEEGAQRTTSTGYRWVIDPLDGTTNYLYRHPMWAVSIGIEYDGHPVVGVVHAPMINMLFSAHTKGGATRNADPIMVGDCHDLGHALVGTGFGYKPEMRTWQGGILQSLLPQVRDVRRGGSAAIDLCFVAAGLLDGYYERNLNPWDSCAGAVIVREAGGIATSLHAEEPDVGMTIAGNEFVHNALRTRLRDLVDSV